MSPRPQETDPAETHRRGRRGPPHGIPRLRRPRVGARRAPGGVRRHPARREEAQDRRVGARARPDDEPSAPSSSATRREPRGVLPLACCARTSGCRASPTPSTPTATSTCAARCRRSRSTPSTSTSSSGSCCRERRVFNELLALGFLGSMRKEWAWRVSRGESTRNLEAFRHLLDDGSERADRPSLGWRHDLHARPRPPRRKRLERQEPLHRLGRRRPHRQGPGRGACAPASCSRTPASCPTSCTPRVLRRAITTANLSLDAADRHWIPVKRDWRLNERHYGALQGKNKKQTLEQYGEEQFMLWRRSYDVPPPPIDAGRRVLPAATPATPASAPRCPAPSASRTS